MKLIGTIKDQEKFHHFIKKIPNSAVTGQVQGTSQYHIKHGNEDAILNVSEPKQTILGIADGHGGEETAQFIANPECGIASEFKNKQPINPDFIISAFSNLQGKVRQKEAGSTLSIVIDHLDDDHLWAANIADSPIVIVTPAGDIYRSIDQDYKNPQEIDRMRQRNVLFCNNRFWTENWMGLQVSKDFGRIGSIKGFEPVPAVYKFNKNNIAFILLASDGINDAYNLKDNSKHGSKYTRHMGIDDRSSKPEDGWVDDVIQEALRISPDPDTPFNSEDLRALAKHYGQFHSDDMSIILQGITSKAGNHQAAVEPVIQNTTLGTLKRLAQPDDPKHASHMAIDDRSSKPEDGWVDDVIQGALRISPDDPDTPFNSEYLRAPARHDDQFHGDDMSINLQGITPKAESQAAVEPVIQNTSLETLKSLALPVTVTVGASVVSLITYRYFAKKRKGLKKRQTLRGRYDTT